MAKGHSRLTTTVKIDRRSVERELQRRRLTAKSAAQQAGISYWTMIRALNGGLVLPETARAIEHVFANDN